MNRLKIVILLGFCIMFAAGFMVGRGRYGAQPAKPDPHFPTLTVRLKLTPAQETQIQKIWHDARAHADKLAHQFREFDHERDNAIAAMLTAEQKQKYDQILKVRDGKAAVVRGDIAKIMHGAEDQMRPLLSPEQLKDYEEMLKQHRHHGPPMPPEGDMGMGFHRRIRESTTRPATEPDLGQ